jgi:uncharacterized protein YceK
MLRWMSLFAGLALLSGCGTISSGASGCGGPWSGVQSDGDLLRSYASRSRAEREVPLGVDGWLGDAWDTIAVALDLPFSALGDTLSTPVTYPLGQRRPEPVGLGCGWVPPGHP